MSQEKTKQKIKDYRGKLNVLKDDMNQCKKYMLNYAGTPVFYEKRKQFNSVATEYNRTYKKLERAKGALKKAGESKNK